MLEQWQQIKGFGKNTLLSLNPQKLPTTCGNRAQPSLHVSSPLFCHHLTKTDARKSSIGGVLYVCERGLHILQIR